jgi:type III restriction enzyme
LVIAGELEWDEVVVRTVALSRTAEAREALEVQCGSRVESWRRNTAGTVARLKPTQRQEFECIFAPNGSALTSNLGIPETISQKTETLNKETGLVEELPLYAGHLYALPDTKLYPETFTGWEESVLEAEQSSGTLLGWYRNPVGGSHALSVHYLDSEVSKNLYPDFLFFHDDGDDGVAVDLVDPHNHSLANTAPKWAALARYVREHDGDFRRAAIVIRDTAGALSAVQLSGQTDDSLEKGWPRQHPRKPLSSYSVNWAELTNSTKACWTSSFESYDRALSSRFQEIGIREAANGFSGRGTTGSESPWGGHSEVC